MPDDVALGVQTAETVPPGLPPADAPALPADETTATPHPLEPEGERFKEVWARAKKAEASEKVEREARIRAEERAKVLEEMKTSAPTTQQPEYGWDQLQKWIDAGQITMAQALEYREKRVAEKVTADAQAKTRQELTQQQRTVFMDGEIEKFLKAIPSIHDLSSPERQRAEQEFAYLMTVDGITQPSQLDADTKKRYDLKALRAAFGDPAAITSAQASDRQTRTNRETFMETSTSGGPHSSTWKDPLKNLTAHEREHYERMIKHGRYRDPNGKKSSWDLIREELTWTRQPH